MINYFDDDRGAPPGPGFIWDDERGWIEPEPEPLHYPDPGNAPPGYVWDPASSQWRPEHAVQTPHPTIPVEQGGYTWETPAGSPPPVTPPVSPEAGNGGAGGGGGANTAAGGFPGVPGYLDELTFPAFNPAPFDYPEWAAPSWDVGEFNPDMTGLDVMNMGFNTDTNAFTVDGKDVLGKRPDFVGPTAATFQTDPGYEFRLAEGQRALRNEAAASGLARSGGFLKGLGEYSQGVASQEFGNVWNRGLMAHQTNLGADNDFYNRLTSTQAGQRANRAQRFDEQALEYDRDFQAEQNEFTNALTSHLTGYGAASDAWDREHDIYNTNFNASSVGFGLNQAARNNKWAQLLGLYQTAMMNKPTYTPLFSMADA